MTNPVGQQTQPQETVTVTIDGVQTQVPKGARIIEAAEMMGKGIAHYCYHPALSAPAMCRPHLWGWKMDGVRRTICRAAPFARSRAPRENPDPMPHRTRARAQALPGRDELYRLLVENVTDYAIILLSPDGRPPGQ